MRPHDLNRVIIGLVVGLLVGMGLVGLNDDLRTELFGAGGANDAESEAERATKVAYYLADLPAAQAWLAEKFPAEQDRLKDAVEAIAKFPTAREPREAFQKLKDPIQQTVLLQAYKALTGRSNDSATVVCLGMDSDPHTSEDPALYLYLTLPTSQIKNAGIPVTWEKLSGPKTNDLFWQLLACYPSPEQAL